MPTPSLLPLSAPRTADDVAPAVAAAAAALDGTGPAVLPLPLDPVAADRVVRAMRPSTPVEADGACAVVVTSGSTGSPKGALLTGDALRHSAGATYGRLGGPGVWLLALPVHHVAGLQVLVRSALAGTLPELLGPTSRFSAGRFVDATSALARRAGGVRRYTALVPTQLVRLLDAGGEAVAALASYDVVLLGGAATTPALLARAREAGARVVTTYGMSETCGGCVYDGRPLNGVRVEIAGDGRIRLGGPVLFSGYRLRPDLTARALVDGWHLTNDLGRVEGEMLTVLGRADDVVVTGGDNVRLGLVEELLAEHPAVREAAAVGVPDAEWGQRVVAVVVPGADPPALADLRAFVADRAGPAAAPRQLLLIDALPLAGPGKVDRRALRTLAAADRD